MERHPNRWQLMEHAQKELKGPEATSLEEHLASCSHCKRELERWHQLEADLRSFPMVAEPASFTASVMHSLEPVSRAAIATARPGVEPELLAAAAALLLALVALLPPLWNWLDPADMWQWGADALTWAGLLAQAAPIWLGPLAAEALARLTDVSTLLTAALLLAALALGPLEPGRSSPRSSAQG